MERTGCLGQHVEAAKVAGSGSSQYAVMEAGLPTSVTGGHSSPAGAGTSRSRLGRGADTDIAQP